METILTFFTKPTLPNRTNNRPRLAMFFGFDKKKPK